MNTRFKYPRTPHLPWSPGATSDDIRCVDTDIFIGKQVVVTEKMDGENTTIYNDHCHARSLDSRHHVSRDWVKRFQATIAHDIPEGWRICGENLFAQHSIVYDSLKSYFYGFSIWNEKNICLDWHETLHWFELLNIDTPPILYNGEWNEDQVKRLTFDTEKVEGYVVRLVDEFSYESFGRSVAKWVRKNHVQTDQHWMHAEIVANGLMDDNGGES
ncbi:RNA ligase family protein [Pleionea sediminis]|uniref:RNA ligase family protein n=1 Tax=Pleionea sediminis TaxID=2569479 RepID=UPI0011871915|nr:RNA ligase family protein [Pleionea sediminis]